MTVVLGRSVHRILGGYSGIRWSILQTLQTFLGKRIDGPPRIQSRDRDRRHRDGARRSEARGAAEAVRSATQGWPGGHVLALVAEVALCLDLIR